MEESVIPRRAIEQSEMTKPFLIPHHGSVFFLSKWEVLRLSLSRLKKHYYRTDGKITAIKVAEKKKQCGFCYIFGL